MSNNYEKLFEELKKFKGEQDKQKQRGLNNYNILTTVLKEHDEVRLHSRVLASLLDPSGEHYQSTLFLDKFLEVLNITDFKIISKNCSVYREYQNIDIYITDGDKHIIIENKIYAKDQEEQIKRYVETIEKENKKLDINDILVIYLTLDRERPSNYSLGGLSIEQNIIKRGSESIALFQSIHYKKEILKWLEISKYEVQNITNLNEVFKQYIDVVKMINNVYEDKIMSLSDYISNNESIYKLANEIEKKLPKIRKKIIDDFFEKIIILLNKKLGDEWIIEIDGKLSTAHKGLLHIYKKEWNKKGGLIFGFSFDKSNYYDGYFGIKRRNKNINIKTNVINPFQIKLDKLNYRLETDEWWLHWEWLPNTDGLDDFAAYIQFYQESEKEFLSGIMNVIKILELDSGLMTEMNEYLSSKS